MTKRQKQQQGQLPADWKSRIPAGHKTPKSRREFLAHGLLGMTGMLAMPGLLTYLMEQRAYGAPNCGDSSIKNAMTPLLIYDMVGGANIAYGNVLVGATNPFGTQSEFLDDQGALLLGCPSDQNPYNNASMIDSELGLLFHANSGFLAGFRSGTTPETRANMEGVVVCGKSFDDLPINPLNPALFMAAAGAKGALVDIVGNGASSAKGYSQVPTESLMNGSTAQIANSLAAKGIVSKGVLTQLLAGHEDKIIKAAQAMSSHRLAKFEAKSMPEQMKELVECGYIKAVDNLTLFSEDSVDPSKDSLLAQASNLNSADARVPSAFSTVTFNKDVVGTMAKLVLDGYAGVGTISSPNFDYHVESTRTAQIRHDFRAGREAALCFEMARLKQKPLAMIFITDGGVGATGGAAANTPEGKGLLRFTSDDGTKGAAFMLVYNPKSRPQSTGIRQIGGYLNKVGSVDQNTPVGNNPANMAKALVLNYLALHGREGEFEKIVKTNPFGDRIVDNVAFAKLKT